MPIEIIKTMSGSFLVEIKFPVDPVDSMGNFHPDIVAKLIKVSIEGFQNYRFLGDRLYYIDTINIDRGTKIEELDEKLDEIKKSAQERITKELDLLVKFQIIIESKKRF